MQNAIVIEGCKLSEETKGTGTLWTLADGEHNLFILEKRAAFKSGKIAVTTTKGITTIGALFLNADPQTKKDHENTKGDFQFSPKTELLAVLKDGVVKELSYPKNTEVKAKAKAKA